MGSRSSQRSQKQSCAKVGKEPSSSSLIRSQPPALWPALKVNYIDTPLASSTLPKQFQKKYCSVCLPSQFPNIPPRLRIVAIPENSPIHPARGQFGLFNGSSCFLEKGTWIRDYIGIVHNEAETDITSDYDLCLERQNQIEGGDVIGIDATQQGNEARFVNDYRGIMERPNAVFELRSFQIGKGPDQEGVRMAIWAGPKGVEKGVEICVSYGRGFWDGRRSDGCV